MIKCTLVLVLFVGLSGYIEAQENLPNPEDVLKKVSGVIDVPGLDKINSTVITAGLEKAEEKLREKCDKYGGPEAYDKAKDASKDMEVCLRSLVNVTEMQAEMEIAKPKGDLDIVFKKYCQRSPILKECITNFTLSIEPCLEEKEKESKKYIQNITESLLGFICFKEGDRIALFISTGGPECFQSKQQQILECGNSTFGSYIMQLQEIAVKNGGALPGPESLPKLTFEHEQCTKIADFQTCVVKVLETCEDPTPANIVESILNFVKRATPCERLLKANTKSASGLEVQAASSASNILSSILVTISVFLMIRYM